MRARLLAILPAAMMLAGCGNAMAPPTAGTAAPGPRSAARPGSPSRGVQPSGSPAAAGRGCRAAAVPRFPAGFLTGVQFVSAADGWVVGQDKILATTDGGRQWTVQDSGQLDLTSVDFVSSEAGWAVGTHSVLATLDGGAHWAALPEPCPLIRSVHFVSPDVGFAVAGGRNVTDFGPEAPEVAGVVMVTSDGGRSWRVLPAPAGAQTICFSAPAMAGWAPAGGCTAPLTGPPLGAGHRGGHACLGGLSVHDDRAMRWHRLSLGPGHRARCRQQPAAARRLPRGPSRSGADLRRAVFPASRRPSARGVARRAAWAPPRGAW
jgi:hypothetical protein